MSDILRIAPCQFDVIWNDPLANFATIEELVSPIAFDILILPEMFSTGYFSNPSGLKDPLAIKTKKWMASQSASALILGSCANKEKNIFYNSLLGYHQQKEICNYKKTHTFVGEEQTFYTRGDKQSIIDFKGWKISLNICYDLRFPVWCRTQEADIMIFSANWPKPRAEHWQTLLKARAIENQCYVIGVNRIGKDNNGLEFQGDTLVFDYNGKEMLNFKDKEGVDIVELSKKSLSKHRKEFPFLADRDHFTLNL